MSSQQWSIRIGADSVGPLTASELQLLAANGSIKPDTPVSPDGEKWWTASQVRGLEFCVNAPQLPPKFNSAAADTGSSIVWIVAGIGGLLLAILLVGALSSFQRAAPTAPSIANAGESTTRYWIQTAQILASLNQEKATDAATSVQHLRATADSLERLPTVGVDTDAVSCGLEVAKLLREIAAIGERGNDPSLLIEALVRGASGDPYGTSLEIMQSQRAIRERVQAVQQYAAETRAILSARYGVEFPAL
jgi:hypothetical protein